MDLGEISLDPALVTDGSCADPEPLMSPWEQGSRDFTAVLQTLLDSKPVTLALVEGPALGGGTGLVAACDLVLASEQANFALPELLLGLVPAIILPVLAERLGLHQAKRWAITQATWQAGEAQARGLVDQVVPNSNIEATLKRTLRTLLRVHPRGVTALKRYARKLSSTNVVASMLEGQKLLLALLSQSEARADVIAFRDFGILPGQTE
jgi:enoyl-CoA hydratase/carnithine racemase